MAEGSCRLLSSYFVNRTQRVKIGNSRSQWETIYEGAAQGSIMGPFCFNVLCIDLFFLIADNIRIFNYADDTTIMSCDINVHTVIENLENTANVIIDWYSNNSMKVNPDKFNAIIFCKNECVNLTFNDITIKSMDEVKLLGIKIDKQLTFNSHVSDLCQKTSRQVNALCRLRNVASKESKFIMYKTYILSNFNYCSTIWHYCGKIATIKIEKLNKRALRIVFNDNTSTYNELLSMSKNECLFVMREKCIISAVFKCINNIAPSYLNNLFKMRDSLSITRRKNMLLQPKVRTTKYGLLSMRYDGARLWNNVMASNIYITNINEFKAMLKNHLYTCQCNMCIFCDICRL